MDQEIQAYHSAQTSEDQEICDILYNEITNHLPEAENKVWHRHPVWFLNGNPIVGYSKLKNSIRLMFWSGVDFGEEALKAGTGKFKDASIHFAQADEIPVDDLKRWIEKARNIQWDYKNIIKRKGRLERL